MEAGLAVGCEEADGDWVGSGLQPFSVCRPLSTWWARRRPPVFASLFFN